MLFCFWKNTDIADEKRLEEENLNLTPEVALLRSYQSHPRVAGNSTDSGQLFEFLLELVVEVLGVVPGMTLK